MQLIRDMIVNGSLTSVQMAKVAGCSDRAVKVIRRNLRCDGSTNAPYNGGGRRRSMTPPMRKAFCQRLLEKPDRYLDELVVFLWDKFKRLTRLDRFEKHLVTLQATYPIFTVRKYRINPGRLTAAISVFMPTLHRTAVPW
jgi:hypothetical protein